MSFIEKNLAVNEQIIYKGKIHWYIYLRGLFFIVLSLCVGKASYTLTGFLFVVGLISLILAAMVVSSSEFVITNRRVILKTGIIRRNFIELQLNKSDGLRIEQGIMGRMFNFGSIKVTSTGVTESYSFLSKPFDFKKNINNAIEGSFVITRALLFN